jgi:hypothetical protein
MFYSGGKECLLTGRGPRGPYALRRFVESAWFMGNVSNMPTPLTGRIALFPRKTIRRTTPSRPCH